MSAASPQGIVNAMNVEVDDKTSWTFDQTKACETLHEFYCFEVVNL